MKPNLFTWFALIVMLSLSACTNEELLSDVTTNKYEVDFGDTNVAESTLSVDEALNNMNFVYRNFDKEQQKERRIRTIELLKSSNLRPATRSGSAEDLPVAYIVNFENESGYAILGADDRMPPIIMLGDEGSFSTEDYLEFLQKSQTRSGGEIDFNNPEEVQYAMITNGFPIYNDPANNSRLIVPAPLPIPRDTSIILKVWPLVKTKFTQNLPYNYYLTPILDNGVLKWPKAGCVPIAAAQVITSMMFHKNRSTLPQIVREDGLTFDIDWKSILRSVSDTIKYSPGQFTKGSLAIANLNFAIGQCTASSYGLSYTGSAYFLVPSVFSSIGLKDAEFIPFNKDEVYDMIVNKGLAVYVRAEDSFGANSSHSFVVDGLIRMQYTTDIYLANPIGQLTGEQIPLQSTFDLVHCNFGEGGEFDGYYTPGSFDLADSEYWEYSEPYDIPAISFALYDLNVSMIRFNM